jgi:hypothetical protein
LEFPVPVWAFKVIETLFVAFMACLSGIGIYVFQFEAAFSTELRGSIIRSDHPCLTSSWQAAVKSICVKLHMLSETQSTASDNREKLLV